jgi:urocanate hydratase
LLSPDQHLQPLVDSGLLLTIWMALSGEPKDLAAVDRLALHTFPETSRLQDWLALSKSHVRFQGLPARVTWLSFEESIQLAVTVNELVSKREISVPILLGWHFALPGTNVIAPRLLEWLLKAGAAWLHFSGMGSSPPQGIAAAAMVLDGTDETRQRLDMYFKAL